MRQESPEAHGPAVWQGAAKSAKFLGEKTEEKAEFRIIAFGLTSVCQLWQAIRKTVCDRPVTGSGTATRELA